MPLESKFAEQYLEGKPLTIAGSIEQIRKEVGTKLLASLDAQSLDSNAGGTDTSCKPIATTERSKATAARGICRDNLVDISKLPKAKFGHTEELLCDICQKVFKKQGALTTHIKSHLKNTETYEKPKRPCPFCEKLQTQLRRHITSEHAEIPAVIEVMIFPENSKERRAGFDQLRKEGIDVYNRKQAAQEVPAYMAERKVDDEGSLVRCSKCKGYYKRTFFYRHKEICIGDDAQIPRKLEMSNRKVHSHDEEFQADILSRFHRDTVGNLCRTDDTLFVIGRRLFQVKKKRVDKDMEIRKSVMSDMRLLARVYIEFQETSVDYLVGHHNINRNDKKVVELEKFIKTLEFHKDIVFGDAAYAIELNRLERLRVPENRLIDEDVEALRNHTLQVIKKITSTFTFIGVHEYILLRDALCSRLTLYNARRGGEPSRLKISNFIEAKNKRWIDSNKVDSLPEWEKKLFQNHLITYQPGKGTHLVPVLIPQDCVDGLDILICSDTRQRAKIWKENSYLFPNTGFSADHTSGWNATHKLAKEAGVKRLDLVNATKQRHRISTLYCALEIPEKERQYFYKHMGHTKEVNWGTYQYPLPIMEITKVGKHLQDIDKGIKT
ncbi:hypothetical protein MAR_002169 [Mya arenaria]|uniref:C2H2-type domain-containing protein n=1 Tax=Mya arenaria TaxID=6604 RepID=A0ABY7FHU5_MYAAR|nr:hypothetical protein MAR_002169 [Mya arenaria]